MARPVLASKGTVSVVTTASATPTYPASVAANDIVVIELVKYDGLPGTHTPPAISGYTLIGSRNLLDATSGIVGYVAWYWQRATGALSGTVTITPTGGTGATTITMAQIYRITGCRTSGNPFDNTVFSGALAAASAVTWSTIREYHSAEELPVLFSGGAGAGLTQPPVTPTGVTATTAADSSTTGADGYVLAYTATTPADPSVGPFASSTSRVQWGALAINFVSAAYVGQSLISGTDTGGATEDATEVAQLSLTDVNGTATEAYILAQTTPSHRQSQGVDAGTNTVISLTLTNPVKAGSTILVLARWNDAAAASETSTCADSLGNTYTTPSGANLYDPSGPAQAQLFVATVAADGSDTITVTLPGSRAAARMVVAEYQGVASVGAVDARIVSSPGGATADNVVAGSISVPTNGMLVSFITYALTGTVTAGTGFTARASTTRVALEDEIPGVSGSYAATWSDTTADTAVRIFAIALAPVVAGGGSTPVNGSDTNGTTTENTVEIATASTADTNGATTEASIETAPYTQTDANGTTTENALEIIKPNADTNTTVDASQIAARMTGSDVNGADTESAAFVSLATVSDTNASSESPTLKAVETGTDSNTSSENGNTALSVSGSDSNASSDTATLKAAYTTTDFNGSGENTILGVVLPVSDASVTSSDQGTLAQNYILTDANGPTTDAIALVVKITTTEINGETDSGSVSTGGTPVFGSDTGSGSEINVTKAVFTQTDTNSESEASILAAKPIGTDAAGATESTNQGRVGSEAGSGLETAQEAVLYVLADAGISTQTAIEAVQRVVIEIGVSIDSSLISVTVLGADSATDLENGIKSNTVVDFGVGFDNAPTANDNAFTVTDLGHGGDTAQTVKWPYFPDEPPEILVASELEPAVLVAAGQPAAGLVATQDEAPELEIRVPQKPSITRVGTDKPKIERIN